MRHSSNSEVLMFKHPVEQKFSKIFNNLNGFDSIGSLGPEDVCDFEFISNFQAIQIAVKNTFGYITSRTPSTSTVATHNVTQSTFQNSIQNVPAGLSSSIGGCHAAVGGPTSKQPPISRPNSTSVSSALNGLNGNTQDPGGAGLAMSLIGNSSVAASSGSSTLSNYSNVLTNGLAQGIANLATLSSCSPNTVSSMLNGGHQNTHQNHMQPHNGSSNGVDSNHIVNSAGTHQQGNSANLLANGINGIHLNSVNNSGASQPSSLKSVLQLEHQRHNGHFGSTSSPVTSLSRHQHNSNYPHNSVTSLCQNSSSQQLSSNGILFENGLLTKRMGGSATLGSLLNGVSEYEKWSNGSNR